MIWGANIRAHYFQAVAANAAEAIIAFHRQALASDMKPHLDEIRPFRVHVTQGRAAA